MLVSVLANLRPGLSISVSASPAFSGSVHIQIYQSLDLRAVEFTTNQQSSDETIEGMRPILEFHDDIVREDHIQKRGGDH